MKPRRLVIPVPRRQPPAGPKPSEDTLVRQAYQSRYVRHVEMRRTLKDRDEGKA